MSKSFRDILSRRDFVRVAVVGAIASVGSTAAARSARVCPRVPRARHSHETTPFVLESELGTVIEGELDLTTVERLRKGKLLNVDLHLDTLRAGESVRGLTDKIEQLALVNPDLHRPETALLTWGTGLAFRAVVEEVRVAYTAFKPDGVPVRAVANATFEVTSDCEAPDRGR